MNQKTTLGQPAPPDDAPPATVTLTLGRTEAESLLSAARYVEQHVYAHNLTSARMAALEGGIEALRAALAGMA